jgi:hypothetical protein
LVVQAAAVYRSRFPALNPTPATLPDEVPRPT